MTVRLLVLEMLRGIKALVQSISSGDYELVAGERRLKAAQLAGLTKVPAIIREMDDVTTSKVQLVENLQREDLNLIEETEGILKLLSIELGVSANEVVSVLNSAANAKKRNLDLTENIFRQLETLGKVPGLSAIAAEALTKQLMDSHRIMGEIEGKTPRTYLCVDEAKEVKSSLSIKILFNDGRKYGLRAVLACQRDAEISDEAIANSATKIVLADNIGAANTTANTTTKKTSSKDFFRRRKCDRLFR